MEPLSPSRVVRFDTECVLIPDSPNAAKLPFVLTKSYSLPLWKTDQDESRVVIKLPIPHFRRRASLSPRRSVSTSPVVPRAPLPSCLVHADASTPLRPVRRASISSPRDSATLLTVPLRPCCAACEAATDEALAEGDSWKINFSRGAKRRRSASLEQPASSSPSLFGALGHVPPPSSDSVPRTFPALSADLDPSTPLHIVRGGAAVATAFALRVDEVEQRRRSFSFSHEEEHYAALRRHVGSPPPGRRVTPLNVPSASADDGPGLQVPHASPYGTFLAPDSYRLRASPIAEEDSSDAARNSTLSLSSNESGRSNLSERFSGSGRSTEVRAPSSTESLLYSTPKSTRRANVPIVSAPGADDDDELFPLPRRSPSASPSPRASPIFGPVDYFGGVGASPGGSASSLMVPGPTANELSTPVHGSTGDDENREEGIIGASLSRRTGIELRIETVPSTPPGPKSVTTPSSTSSTSGRPLLSPRGPRSQGQLQIQALHSQTISHPSSKPIPIPTRSHSADTHFHLPSLHIHTRTTSPNSSQPKSPSPHGGARSPQSRTHSPAQGTPNPHRRVHSLAATFVRAGADMLRGVGGLGVAGGVGSA